MSKPVTSCDSARYRRYCVNINDHLYYSWAWSYEQARLNVVYRLRKKMIHNYFIEQMTKKENDNAE